MLRIGDCEAVRVEEMGLEVEKVFICAYMRCACMYVLDENYPAGLLIGKKILEEHFKFCFPAQKEASPKNK